MLPSCLFLLFQLSAANVLAGAISGTVTDNAGNPIEGATVDFITGDPCGWWQPIQDTTVLSAADGSFLSQDFDPAAYPEIYVRVSKSPTPTPYLTEWRVNDLMSSPDCQAATPVIVGATGTTPSNFQLDPALIISGFVESDSATPVPLDSVCVTVHTDACTWGTQLGGGRTDPAGYYDIVIPADTSGPIYVTTYVGCGTEPYLDANWTSTGGAPLWECSSAEDSLPSVQAGSPINFSLDPGRALVGQVTTGTPGTPVNQVSIDIFDAPCGGQWLGNGMTDSTGDYQVIIPDDGNPYYLRTCVNCSQTPPNLIDASWNSGGGSADCNAAESVPFTGITSYDFNLDPGYSISGTVRDNAGPLTGENIWIEIWDVDPCTFSSGPSAGGPVNLADGSYTVSGLAAGQYYIRANPDSSSSYLSEYWSGQNPGLVYTCDGAVAVNIGPGYDGTGKDFYLEPGATIAGTVIDDTSGSPLANVCINIQDATCGGNWMGGARTDPAGNYAITVPENQTYYVHTDVSCGNTIASTYVNESYDNTTDCNQATGVTPTVAAPAATAAIDFALAQGVQLTGIIYQSDGTTPLTGVNDINISLFRGSCEDRQHVDGGPINPNDGTYSFTTGQTGTFFLAYDSGWGNTANYIPEFWNSSGYSVQDCAQATPITIAVDPETGELAVTPGGDKNFQLDPGGIISGTVFNADGSSGLTDTSIRVEVFSSGRPACEDNSYVAATTINSDGTFTIPGLPAGDYYLRTYTGQTNYISEWYAGAASSTDCADALTVPVTVNVDNQNNNFQLAEGVSASGTLYEESTGQPLTGVDNLKVSAYTGDPCGHFDWISSGLVNAATGTFTVNGLQPGVNYFFRNRSSGETRYVTEWYGNSTSSTDCTPAQANPVNIAPGGTATGIDFYLSQGVYIWGTIYQEDATTPITDTPFEVLVLKGDTCESLQFVGYGESDQAPTGLYKTAAVEAGNYYLKIREANDPPAYEPEWWKDPASVSSCSAASYFTVTAAEISGLTDVTDKNFQLHKTVNSLSPIYLLLLKN